MKKIYLIFLFGVSCLQIFARQSDGFKLHAHNDYLRNVPFWEALAAGCASIEVDVILQDGQLMAAHEVQSIQEGRTLTSLYLDPISHAKKLGIRDGVEFSLLVDFKTEAYATMEVLLAELRGFEPLLYSPDNPSGLKLVISGNRPKVEDYIHYPDYILFDYQDTTLDESLPWHKIAMVSLSFRQFSKWNGKGRMVAVEKDNLLSFITQVHSFDRPVRFWGSPDSKSAWKAFADLGVDYINTDTPAEARQYLQNLRKNSYGNRKIHPVVQPSFRQDGKQGQVDRILFLIGDGNGLAQISAGLFANGNRLNMTQLKNIGLVKTQSEDDFTTDSAAGATAYATGKKTNNRAIGVDASGNFLRNLPELIRPYGFSSGIVTTDRVTGATPASFYAHHDERDEVDSIASFLAFSDLDLFIGAGRTDFVKFGKDRLEDLKQQGFELVEALDQVSQASQSRVGHFAAAENLPTVMAGRTDFLQTAAVQALGFLESRKSPFFLMVESAMIDSGGHGNNTEMIVTEMLDFDRVIGEMIRYVDNNPTTLLVITADHETGGVSLPQGRLAANEVELAYHSDDHTGIPVPVFAYGAHSDAFRGVYENTEVFVKLLELIKTYHPAVRTDK